MALSAREPSNVSRTRIAALIAIALAGCSRAQSLVAGAAQPRSTARAPAARTATVAATATPSSNENPPAAPAEDTGSPCGAFDCRAFASAKAAFAMVLASHPRVLAIGEAHAQKGTEHVLSATRRFTEQLLPELADRASDIVIELVVANGRCGRSEQRVAEQQQPITEHQAASAQNEFLLLGERAKALGIAPHPLVPTCEEYASITNAGSGDIDRLLSVVAAASERTLSALLDRAPAANAPALIVAYGGALHNDLSPRPGHERWSFGPALQARTGAYVELDLFVPEYVRDSESWRAFPWYGEYAAHGAQDPRSLLYRTGPSSFALFFPRSA